MKRILATIIYYLLTLGFWALCAGIVALILIASWPWWEKLMPLAIIIGIYAAAALFIITIISLYFWAKENRK